MDKPMYGKFLTSSEFPSRDQAEKFAKDMKEQYRQIEKGIRFDIERTPSQNWRATVYAHIPK